MSTGASLRKRQANAAEATKGSKSSPASDLPQLRPNPFGAMLLTGLASASVFALVTQPFPKQQTIALAVGWYLLSALSDSAGYHRLWAHKSYQARFPLTIIFALFGAGNFTGSILEWVRNHRAHHRQIDTPKDPFNRKLGFFYSFLGHHCIDKSSIGEANVKDLENDWVVLLQKNLYLPLAVFMGLVLPALIASTWDDTVAAFWYAGVIRTFVFIFAQSFFWALARTFGHRPYNDTHSPRNNILVSLCTLGEGYLNFHYEFPSDYRLGCFYYHLDATKWILRALSLVGLTHKFNKTPSDQILRVRIQKKQAELDEVRKHVEFGPDPATLPVWTWEAFEKKVAEGRSLIVIDGIVHDVQSFFDKHPGGAEVLKPKIGKDATIAFNGGVQRHSKAARNLATFMRIAVVDGPRKKKTERA